MPDEDFLPPVLTRALADLHAVEVDEQVLTRVRAELMTKVETAPKRPRRHWGRWAAAAAVVVALAAGLLVVQTFTDTPRAASAAGEVLIKAADQIKNVDPVLQPGQYLYSRAVGWHTTGANGRSGKSYTYLGETRSEVWIPARFRDEWLGRYSTTGQRRWITGTEAEARADGVDLDHPLTIPDGEVRAPCGDFTAVFQKQEPCAGSGGWVGGTTPEFFDSLPTDPQELYDLLRRETAGRGPHPDVEMLVYTENVIARAPAKNRAAFYRALALMPSLRITEQVATLDGQTGIAIGVEGGPARMELVVDAQTGRFIGSREWREGQLTSTGSVWTTIVTGMGTQPN